MELTRNSVIFFTPVAIQMHVQCNRRCQRTTQGINDEYLELFNLTLNTRST